MDKIDRLVRIADVWCAIKYFHPFLAYRKDIDWDAALINALPAISEAVMPAEYVGAVRTMLAVLGDKATFVHEEQLEEDKSPIGARTFLRRTDDGKLIVTLAAAGAAANDWEELTRRLTDLCGDLAQASGVVFDCRGCEAAASAFAYSGLNRRLSATTVIGAGERSRVHIGYRDHAGAGASGYGSTFQISDGSVFDPDPGTRDIPCVFILDAAYMAPPIALALQSAGKAAILMQGEVDDGPFVEHHGIDLGEGFTVYVRTSELVHADGTTGVMPDLLIPSPHQNDDAPIEAALAWLAAPVPPKGRRAPLPIVSNPDRDRAYADMAAPAAPYRLLAAFRIWGVINYFFPYRELIGEDWQGVLREFLPRFEAADDAGTYARTIAEMVVRARDSHCFVRSAALAAELGSAPPAVHVRLIEGVPLVTRILDTAEGLAVGDVVLAVDGVDAQERMALEARYRAASTPQARDKVVARRFLNGAEGSIATLTLQGQDGTTKEARLRRTATNHGRLRDQRDGDILTILAGDIGYADLDRLPMEAVDDMFERFRETRAIIFDVRGYPRGTAFSIAPRLTERNDVVAAHFTRPVVSAASLSCDHDPRALSVQCYLQRLPRTSQWRYGGKTLMLIDERTVSHAEHTGLFLKAANGTIFVGSGTTGANGNVTNFVVPGDILITFTGLAVKHPDGRQLQRVGLVPDVEVTPTIAGIRAGRDEVLEKALEIAHGG